MESKTIDKTSIVDGDFGDPIVLGQEVVIPFLHNTKPCKCIVTPCTILEYHVEHPITNSTSLILTIILNPITGLAGDGFAGYVY